MSETVNPQNQDIPMGSGYPYGSVDRGYSTSGVEQRSEDNDFVDVEPPGLVAFAAVMMFILGAFQLTWAIVEYVNAAWLSSVTYGNFNGLLWLWGIVDTIVAI